MKVGELLWCARVPGGWCLFLGDALDDCGEESYWILHPYEGVIEDSAYYYDTLEQALYNSISLD